MREIAGRTGYGERICADGSSRICRPAVTTATTAAATYTARDHHANNQESNKHSGAAPECRNAHYKGASKNYAAAQWEPMPLIKETCHSVRACGRNRKQKVYIGSSR